MTSIFATSQFDERRVFRVLRRRLALIVLAAVVAAGAGLAVGLARGETFGATAQVLLAHPVSSALLGSGSAANSDARNAVNELQVLQSDPVNEAAEKTVGHTLTIVVAAVDSSDVALVTSTSPTAAQAADDANAYAQAYVTMRTGQVKTTIDATVASLQGQINDIQAKLDPLDASVRNAPDADDRDAVVAEVTPQRNALLSQQNDLQSRLADFKIRSQVANTAPTIAAAAVVPTGPSTEFALIYALLGGLFGLLVGVWLAFSVERRRGRVVNEADLRSVGVDPTAVLVTGRGDNADGYQRLVARVAPLRLGKSAQSFVVVPVDAQSAGQAVSIELATALARLGRRTALVDVGRTDGNLNSRLGLPTDVPGLSDVIRQHIRLTEALVTVRGVVFLPAGNGSADIPLDPNRFVAVLAELRGLVEVVLVTVPAPRDDSASVVLAPLADGVILVAARRRSLLRGIREAVGLVSPNQQPAGVVVTGPRGRDDGGGRSRSTPTGKRAVTSSARSS